MDMDIQYIGIDLPEAKLLISTDGDGTLIEIWHLDRWLSLDDPNVRGSYKISSGGQVWDGPFPVLHEWDGD